jgi:PAS domain S-box-containing protein
MDADSGPGSIRTGENTLHIASLILISVVLIFYIDILTPLGLAIWILYFIPLFLTLYLEWRHGPFVITGVIIILTVASLFLSPRDISLLLALLDRIFFCLLLAASALLIGNYKKNEEILQKSEEHYRILVEWSPDAIVVYLEGAIIYANIAFLRLFTANETDNPVGRNILDLIRPADRQLVQERISQVAMGAQVQIPDMYMIRPDGSEIRADLSLREVIWDNSPAVLIVIRALASA